MMTPEQKLKKSIQMKKYWEDIRAGVASVKVEKELLKPTVSICDDTLTNSMQEKTEPHNTEVVQTPTIATSVSPLTPEEQAIFSRVSSESREWATIDPRATLDYSLAEDPFKLPEPALKLQKNKEFQFRWIKRSPERLDEVRNAPEIKRWWPVNSTQPVGKAFDKFIDSSTGAVHLLDQVLVFKPYWLWEKECDFKNRLANSRTDVTAKDNQEKNDLRFSASKRKLGESRTRAEVSGEDVQFRGEADVYGDSYSSDLSDMVVNE
jgi:hypothetical protein